MSDLVQNPNEIQLNEQQEIQQIIGDPPNWMLRWGITIIALVLGGLLFLACTVRYADTIDATITLATEVPPTRIIAENSGKLVTIHVKDGDLIAENAPLYAFENTAKGEDVAELEAFLAEALADGLESELQLPSGLALGTLQDDWSAFTESYRLYLSNVENDDTDKQVRYKNRQIRGLENLNTSLADQIVKAENELSISQMDLQRYKDLLDAGTVSELEYNRFLSEHYAKERRFERLGSEKNNNDIEIARLKGVISELREGNQDEGNLQLVKAQENFERLRSKISTWKDSFIETAPVAGKIAFTQRLNTGDYIKEGEELFTIIPTQKNGGKIIGKATLPAAGIGKVKVGHQVQVYSAAYPHMDYGVLLGKVEHISLVPKDNMYLLDVSIPSEMKTTRGFEMPFQQEMTGRAEIITDKRPYMRRVLNKLITAFE